jgi:hypothetical protein
MQLQKMLLIFACFSSFIFCSGVSHSDPCGSVDNTDTEIRRLNRVIVSAKFTVNCAESIQAAVAEAAAETLSTPTSLSVESRAKEILLRKYSSQYPLKQDTLRNIPTEGTLVSYAKELNSAMGLGEDGTAAITCNQQ